MNSLFSDFLFLSSSSAHTTLINNKLCFFFFKTQTKQMDFQTCIASFSLPLLYLLLICIDLSPVPQFC